MLRRASAVFTVAALAACAPGEGSLELRIWGEAYIEEQIPAAAFVDGWTLTYDAFLVSVGALRLAQAGQAADAEAPEFRIFDLETFDNCTLCTAIDTVEYFDNRLDTASHRKVLGNERGEFLFQNPFYFTQNIRRGAIHLRNTLGNFRLAFLCQRR